MEYFNNILCASSQELIKSEQNPKGFTTYSNLHKMCRRSGKLTVVRPGKGKASPLLIEFQSLPIEWQDELKRLNPSPESQAEAKPFKDKIVTDHAAREFFRNYTYDMGTHLTTRLQEEYTNNASILNAIKLVYNKALESRARSGKTTRNFWSKTAEALIVIRKDYLHSMPKNSRSLQRLYNEYLSTGYEALINGRLGNKNSEKITGDILEWLTTEMAHTRQSVEMISMRYPAVAAQKGWDVTITAEAFRVRVSQPEIRQMIDLKRHGRKAFRKLYGHTFKLRKAQYSNDLWVSDGTALSWYYKRPVFGKTGKELRYEPAMATTYVVMDAASKKFLGWSTKEGINKENFEMQLEAYRAALRASGAKPYQLLFDNQGGHKNTESREFYSKLAHVYFPTRAYRPSGKPVEQAFKNFQTLKLAEFPFWSGFGRPSHATVAFSPNMEAIKQNIDSLPTYQELVKLFDVIVAEWNELDFNGAGSPNALYQACKNPDEEPIGWQELADMFWNMQGPKKYKAWGIELMRQGEEIIYEVYDESGNVDYNFRRKYLKQKFFLKYDPAGEYPEVELYQLAADGGYQRVATALQKREPSRSVKYLNEGDKAWIEKQMALESEMMDEMDASMTAIGYNEEVKWNSWRNRIDADQEENAKQSVTLYGNDEGTMEVLE